MLRLCWWVWCVWVPVGLRGFGCDSWMSVGDLRLCGLVYSAVVCVCGQPERVYPSHYIKELVLSSLLLTRMYVDRERLWFRYMICCFG